MKETVRQTSNGISYHLQRKRVKNINMRVHGDGEVFVSAPSFVSAEVIDEFVLSKTDFITRAREKYNEAKNLVPEHHYLSGEKYMLLGEEIELDVSEGENYSAFIENNVLYVKVRNTDNFSERESAVQDYFDRQCRVVFEKMIDEAYPMFKDYGYFQDTIIPYRGSGKSNAAGLYHYGNRDS